jgi:hypothetical protein
MAERPLFVPISEGRELVREVRLRLTWNPGFASIQKEKNIVGLHQSAAAAGYVPVLEVSSKSEKKSGQRLSAFNLKVSSVRHGEMPLESAFQGSKVFERSGPFTDLYRMEPREAKRDPRLKESGALVGFKFDGFSFPMEPKTIFYDWLYVKSLFPHREWCKVLYGYAGFTDIEFNPHRSINCQARSCALFLSLMNRDMLDGAIKAPSEFVRAVSGFDYSPQLWKNDNATADLFGTPAKVFRAG